MKSSVEQIRARFDKDVERFSNLESGHTATIDSPLNLELVTRAAAGICPHATHLLDIGCGAGNYSLKMLQVLPNLNVTLVDLSKPMLERAKQRVSKMTTGIVEIAQADIRDIKLDQSKFDIILAGAVFHHLREEDEWEKVFRKCHDSLKIGGSLWISDMIDHSIPAIQEIMWQKYGEYLVQIKDQAYREQVFEYIAQEDTPRSLVFQMDLLRKVGFSNVEILHKNSVFASFGAIK